jgi:hypothetical protein
MACGLSFLGRGRGVQSWRLVLIHVFGAAGGGAAVGAALGGAGAIFPWGGWRPWAVASGAVVAVRFADRRYSTGIGLHRQVPRAWARTMPLGRLYLLWGALLGSGIATVIPHSAFLVLAVGELAAGPVVASIAGAIFGAAREGSVMIAVASRWDPSRTTSALQRYHTVAARANATAVVVGGFALTASQWI